VCYRDVGYRTVR